MVQLFFGSDESPLSKPEDVIPFLARQERHWKKGRSAYELSYSWFSAQGIPPAVRATLDTDSAFTEATLVQAIFEKQTEIDKTGRNPSQTDLLAVLQTKTGPAVVGVEGKVDEPFGEIVSDWNDYSPSKLRRLASLVEKLHLNSKSIGSLRYQLFHRTVAVLIEAENHSARDAIMLVQSFSPSAIRAGFEDFQKFSTALGTPVIEPGKLSDPRVFSDVRLRLGWIETALHDSNAN